MSSAKLLFDRFMDVTGHAIERFWHLWDTNRWRMILCFLAAMPLLLIMATSVFSAALLIGPGDRVTNWYLKQGAYALAKEEYEIARLSYSALLQKQPDNKQFQFGLAKSLFGLGDISTAMILTRRLAPEDGKGHGPAHLFVAEQLIAIDETNKEFIRRAEHHLLRAYESDPSDPKINALLTAIYAKTERWEQVKRHLPHAGEAIHELGIEFAQIFAMEGDTVEAENWARRAQQFFSNRVLNDKTDFEARHKWAQASLMLRDFPQTLDIVETAYADSKDGSFRYAAAQVCFVWNATVGKIPSRRLSTLQRGLSHNPAHQGLLLQMVDGPFIQAAIDAPVLPANDGGVAQSIIRSIAHIKSGNMQGAKEGLAGLFDDPPVDTLAIIANAGVIWAFSDRPDSGEAVLFMQALSEVLPDNPIAGRAFGLALSRVGRFNRAAPYLEASLQHIPHDVAVLTQLAICYDNMGMPDEAAGKRKILESLQ